MKGSIFKLILSTVLLVIMLMVLSYKVGAASTQESETPQYASKQVTVGDLHWLCLTDHGQIQSCTLLDPTEEGTQ